MKNKLLKKLGSIFIHTHAEQVGICSKCSVVCILSRPFLSHIAFIKLQESIFLLLRPGIMLNSLSTMFAFCIFLNLPFINK